MGLIKNKWEQNGIGFEVRVETNYLTRDFCY